MIGIQHINNIREYCDYVEDHLLNVEKAWDGRSASGRWL